MNGDSPHFSQAQCRIMLSLVMAMLALFVCRYDLHSGGAASDFPGAVTGERRPHFVIEIAGAVARPGIYSFFHEADWAEVIRAAGGLKGRTCMPGELLRAVPVNGSLLSIGTVEASTAVTMMDPHKRFLYFVPFRINQASAEELVLVPGIGETTARAIVSYRERHGGFARLESLLGVPGIGRHTLEKMKDYLAL